MTSEEIVERLGATLKGQQLLFPDADYVLRHWKFTPTGDQEWDRQALVHFWMNVYVPDGHGDMDTPYKVWQSWDCSLWRLFQYCKVSGYNPKTDQSALQISFYKNEPLESQIADLQAWLPHVKPAEIEDSDEDVACVCRYVRIFEHTLSEGGIFDLRIVADDDIRLVKTTYGRSRLLRRFDSLYSACEYVQKNHWYEKRHERTSANAEEDDNG